MNYPLDKSTFLWCVSAQTELSPQARSIIGDSRNNVYLSFVSIWELSIKYRIGKLQLASDSLSDWLDSHLEANSFRLLEVKVRACCNTQICLLCTVTRLMDSSSRNPK